jgi:hypothetical protein
VAIVPVLPSVSIESFGRKPPKRASSLALLHFNNPVDVPSTYPIETVEFVELVALVLLVLLGELVLLVLK